MTHSVPRRKDDLRRALVKLVEIVGDDYCIEHFFRIDDPRLEGVLTTTWREMSDADLIDLSGHDFSLTATGWLTGLRIAGKLGSPEVRARALEMVKALKAQVKGRHDLHDEVIDVREFAKEVNLPEGWVVNALDSGLLQKVFPKDRINASLDPEYKVLIRIPPTFGSDPIDIE